MFEYHPPLLAVPLHVPWAVLGAPLVRRPGYRYSRAGGGRSGNCRRLVATLTLVVTLRTVLSTLALGRHPDAGRHPAYCAEYFGAWSPP